MEKIQLKLFKKQEKICRQRNLNIFNSLSLDKISNNFYSIVIVISFWSQGSGRWMFYFCVLGGDWGGFYRSLRPPRDVARLVSKEGCSCFNLI